MRVGLPAIANIAFGMPPCSSKVAGEGLPVSGRRPRSPKRLDSILRSMCGGPQLCIALTCNALVRDIPCLIERGFASSCGPSVLRAATRLHCAHAISCALFVTFVHSVQFAQSVRLSDINLDVRVHDARRNRWFAFAYSCAAVPS